MFLDRGSEGPIQDTTNYFSGLLRLINGTREQYGLPRPDHKLLESHRILNTQILHYLGHDDCIAKGDVKALDGDDVVFADGSREQIDLLLQATGHHHASPCLPAGTLDDRDSHPVHLDVMLRSPIHMIRAAVPGLI